MPLSLSIAVKMSHLAQHDHLTELPNLAQRATRYWGDARRTAHWLRQCLDRRGWAPDEVLLYTYWLGRQTLRDVATITIER